MGRLLSALTDLLAPAWGTSGEAGAELARRLQIAAAAAAATDAGDLQRPVEHLLAAYRTQIPKLLAGEGYPTLPRSFVRRYRRRLTLLTRGAAARAAAAAPGPAWLVQRRKAGADRLRWKADAVALDPQHVRAGVVWAEELIGPIQVRARLLRIALEAARDSAHDDTMARIDALRSALAPEGRDGIYGELLPRIFAPPPAARDAVDRYMAARRQEPVAAMVGASGV